MTGLQFDKSMSQFVAGKLLGMFPKKNHNLVVDFGDNLIFAGTDRCNSESDTYFSIISLRWKNDNWEIKRNDLGQEDRKDLQKLLCMFIDESNCINPEAFESIKIKVGRFSLSIHRRKKDGCLTERIAIINCDNTKLMKIAIRENGINDLLFSLIFVSRDTVLWNRDNVAVLSDHTTYIFRHSRMENIIDIISYGICPFDIEYLNLPISSANSVRNGSYSIEIPYGGSATSCTVISFGFLASVAIQVFLSRGEPSLL